MPKTKLGTEKKNYGFKKVKGAVKCKINNKIINQETTSVLKKLLESKEYNNNEVEDIRVIKNPFTSVVLKNFIENSDFIDGLKQELGGLDLKPKNNDLYKFRQSEELSMSSSPHIAEFKDMLLEQVRPWLSQITDIELNSNVDLFFAEYRKGDTLLCHDDELEGRRVAFIYYMIEGEPWQPDVEGGCLELFDVDEGGNPQSVVERLSPSNNSLAFFPVSPVSFHQVGEVLTDRVPRLSLTGWFHGPPLPPRPAREIPPHDACLPYRYMEEEEFYSWINHSFLSPETQGDIQERFEENSEISLPDFLNKEKFEQVSSALLEMSTWSGVGPPDRCRRLISSQPESDVLSRCLLFFQSEAFFLLLSNITGLRLHEMAPVDSDEEEEGEADKKDSNPRCLGAFQHWSRGCYTLIRDDDLEQAEYALDLRLFFNCSGWTDTMGGQSSYIARDEDEELIMVEPEDNSLSLVYRDKESMRFIKYVGANVEDINGFHDLACTYYE